jgi:hypothetical protein
VPLLRVVATLGGRRATIDRLTRSLEVDTRPFREMTGWSPRWSLDAALARERYGAQKAAQRRAL